MMRVRFPLPAPAFMQKAHSCEWAFCFVFALGDGKHQAEKRRHGRLVNSLCNDEMGLFLLQLATETVAFAMDGGDDFRLSLIHI